MSNKIVVGSFLNVDSFFHKIHPLTKILMFFAITIFVIVTGDVYDYTEITLIMLVGVSVTNIGIKKLLIAVKPILGIVLFSLILQIAFNKEGTVIYSLGFLKIYSTTVTYSIETLLRVFIMVGSAGLLTLSTEPIEITHGLEAFFKPLKIFKVPVETIALTISLALRFIPLYFEEIERVKIAQKSKGYDIDDLKYFEKFKFYTRIITPLLMASVGRADDLANAMEIRGYSMKVKKTRFREYSITKEDYILVGVFLIIIFNYFKVFR